MHETIGNSVLIDVSWSVSNLTSKWLYTDMRSDQTMVPIYVHCKGAHQKRMFK